MMNNTQTILETAKLVIDRFQNKSAISEDWLKFLGESEMFAKHILATTNPTKLTIAKLVEAGFKKLRKASSPTYRRGQITVRFVRNIYPSEDWEWTYNPEIVGLHRQIFPAPRTVEQTTTTANVD